MKGLFSAISSLPKVTPRGVLIYSHAVCAGVYTRAGGARDSALVPMGPRHHGSGGGGGRGGGRRRGADAPARRLQRGARRLRATAKQ